MGFDISQQPNHNRRQGFANAAMTLATLLATVGAVKRRSQQESALDEAGHERFIRITETDRCSPTEYLIP
jgi:hypothetical protein